MGENKQKAEISIAGGKGGRGELVSTLSMSRMKTAVSVQVFL